MAYAHKRAITIDYTKVTAPGALNFAYPRSGWSASADSQYTTYAPSKAIDTDHSETNCWCSGAGYPHYLIVNFGAAIRFDTVVVDPRSGEAPARHIDTWEMYVSDDGATWGSAVASGTWGDTLEKTVALGSSYTKQYLKIVGLTGSDDYMVVTDVWVKDTSTPTAFTDFPFLFSGTYSYLAHTSHGGAVTSTSGYDIIFTSDEDGNNQLDHEIDTYNHETGAVNFWVRIPSLSSTSDTVIYVWYGDSGVTTSQEDKSGVWPEYLAVYHFGDGSTLSTADSKGSYNGTNHDAAAAAGKIGGCASFTRANSHWIDLGNSINVASEDVVTIEAWIKPASENQYQRIASNLSGAQYNGYEAYLGYTASHSELVAQTGNAGNLFNKYGASDIDTGTWKHISIVMAGALNPSSLIAAFQVLFVNGSNVGGSSSTPPYSIGTSSVNMNIGRWPGGASEYFDGLIDELRIYKTNGPTGPTTAGYLATEIENQNNPSTFYGVGDDSAAVALSAAIADICLAPIDAISSAFIRKLSAAVSDVLRVASDLIYPPPIEATHFDGTLSDALRVISDYLSFHVNKALSGNVADSLEIIREAIGAGVINLETPVRWVAPVSITPRVTAIDPLHLAAHPVLHPSRYYEPRIKSYGTFTRAISAPVGFIRTGDAVLTVLDPDNSIRQRIAAKTIRKAKAEVRLGPEGASLGAFLRPLIREVGTVAQPGDGELTIPLRDYLFDKLEEKTPETWTPESANFADAILSVLVDMMGVEESLDRINLASFDETRDRVDDLICSGTLTESITYAELLTRLQRSSNIDIFADKNDRIAVHYTTDDEIPTVQLDDLLRLYKGTVSQQLAEPTFNRLPFKYNRQVVDGNETWTEDVYDIEADQTALGEIVEDEPLQMYFVADAATAATVIERRAQYLDLDAFRFEGEIPLIPVLENLELADLVGITHFGGIKSGGYVAEQFKILELSMDVDTLKYHFKGIRRRLPPPSSITTTLSAILGTARINSRVGPYASEIYGELFAVFADSGDLHRLRVHYTTDFGATWAVADEANSPVLSDIIQSYDTYDDGTLIHCATQEDSTGRVAYHVFSKETRVWLTIDEGVVSGAECGGRYRVSVECRYPGGEPVIYFQGDKILVSGVLTFGGVPASIYYDRGYYSIKLGGAWSVPVVVTPNPGTGADGISSNCGVERVVSGRENRMHFFWQVNPAVEWIRWSPDEYRRTMQGDLTLGPELNYYMTWVNYPATVNLGDGCVFKSRTQLATLLKGSWGAPEIWTFAEGPTLIPLIQRWTYDGGIDQSNLNTGNPAGFIREHDGVLYTGQGTFVGHVTLQTSDDEGDSWSAQIKAGPQAPPYSHVESVLGTVLKVSGRLYMAYFSYDAYHWLSVDSLPYAE